MRKIIIDIVIVCAGDVCDLIAAAIDHIVVRTVEVVSIAFDGNTDREITTFASGSSHITDLIAGCIGAGHDVHAIRIGCRGRHTADTALTRNQRACITEFRRNLSRVTARIQHNTNVTAIDNNETSRRITCLRLRAHIASIFAIRKCCRSRACC